MKNNLYYSPADGHEEGDCCFVTYNKKRYICLFPDGDHLIYANNNSESKETGTKILTY